MKQTKENLTIERPYLEEVPPEFSAVVQKCQVETGKMFVDAAGKPVMEKAFVVPAKSALEKISITNNTDHVVRLNSAVITYFDPADNQYNSLTKDEIKSYVQQERPCLSTNALLNQLSTIKMIDRNTELLPNRTYTGYLIFMPRDLNIAGTWKFSMYEIPVETDAAGKVTKTVQFDFRDELKKYRTTYRRENALAPAVVVSKEEMK